MNFTKRLRTTTMKKKLKAQVKSRFYYIFWGTATVSVVLGQLYVGTGYRVYASSLTRILDSIEVVIQGPSSGRLY